MSRMPPDPLRPPAPPPLQTPDAQLALDYALGALPRAARQAAAARLHTDAAFAAEVERWQARLDPLNAETDPVLPPASVWQAVQAEIAPAPRRGPVPAPAPKPSLWNSLALWRGLALAGPALAALALILLAPAPASLLPPASQAAPPALLAASLVDAGGTPLLAATFDPLRQTLILTPAARAPSQPDAAASPPATSPTVPELWLIEGKAPPRSLGLIALAPHRSSGSSPAPLKPYAISSQRLRGLQPGAVLAISLEPIGGSPTGLPSGPVIATGTLSAV
jgi:anti-sigma-K factor RskA